MSALFVSGAAMVSASSALSSERFYTGASALAGKSGDYKEFGGSARLGYRVTEKIGVEFEAAYLHGLAKRNGDFVEVDENATQSLVLPGETLEACKDDEGCVASYNENIKITGEGYAGTYNRYKSKLNQVPLMVNARFMDSINSFTYYAGAGVGLAIVSGSYTQTPYSFVSVTTKKGDKDKVYTRAEPVADADAKSVKIKLKTKPKFAGQVFAGVGYAFNEQLSVNVGARCMFTAKSSIKDASGKKLISTKAFLPLAELSVNYSF